MESQLPGQPEPRRYGEKDVARLLKRATELQRSEPGPDAAEGMTLGELEQIAIEVGIDARHLRQAAVELEQRRGSGASTILGRLAGAELAVTREATVPGELDDEDLGRLLAVIQTTVQDHGEASLMGRTLTWSAEAASKTRTTRIVVSARKGQTRILVEENLTPLANGIFGGGVGGAGVGVGIGVGVPVGLVVLGSPLIGFVAPVATLALFYIGAKEIFRRMRGDRQRAVESLFGAIVQEVRESLSPLRVGALQATEALLGDPEPPACD